MMHQIFILMVACLIVLCNGAVPSPPMIADTFCTIGEIEQHSTEATLFGKFHWCRDQKQQLETQGFEFTETRDLYQSLLLYNSTTKHTAFYVYGKVGGLSCSTYQMNVTSQLPPAFDWVKLATYEGQRKIREQTYDIWGLSVADVRLELAVLPGSNKPAYYNRKGVEVFMQYSFQSFNATTPDSSVFDIPKTCQEKQEHKL